jgi:hypothetical protein
MMRPTDATGPAYHTAPPAHGASPASSTHPGHAGEADQIAASMGGTEAALAGWESAWIDLGGEG